MAVPNSKTNLKEYCLRALGKPVIEVNVDDDVLQNNTIKIENSLYNGKYRVSTASTNFFEFTIGVTPEKSSYISSTSAAIINYTTDCVHTKGPISQIEIVSGGKAYQSLPGITTVSSSNGTGAILEADSNTIGQISKTRIVDIGFDFPADKTLKPSVTLPNIIKIESTPA